ncbi:aromatic acid exporter family protein [Alkalihalophilus lindianensis]|uniref:Aromatic acid exporter family protein n=1 Tax=Alkalihalophilus lindianensis TaxID=1630542 RepID=A0ABU3XBK8_9BACI|nr:aromatic acid exporter family protein [Alkalihalophilus lindianensis]MDV2685268.1 aromatic acid exporter family protein [Alkalihalophilus lindianensis]
MRKRVIIGRRVVKTGLAVFITALICHWLDLPATFAVITAIVTTEPTAADSLKKGLVRLPAASIGAVFAIVLDLLLGQSALTYSLVAMMTIIACSKLKLDTGTLVATLTAVAMIPGTTDHVVVDFVTRMSGTSTGIIVSTLVNFVILPPKFGPILVDKVETLFGETAKTLDLAVRHLLHEEDEDRTHFYRQLHTQLASTYQLTQFQYDEWRYRKSNEFERRSFGFLKKKLDYLHLVLFHIGKLCHIRLNHHISNEEKENMMLAVHSFKQIIEDPLHQMATNHHVIIEDLKRKRGMNYTSEETLSLITHELISLQKVAEELASITADERMFSIQEKSYPDYIFKQPFQYE